MKDLNLRLYDYVAVLNKERLSLQKQFKEEFFIERKLQCVDKIKIYDKIIQDLEVALSTRTKEQVHD